MLLSSADARGGISDNRFFFRSLPDFQLPSNTSVIAMAFVNITLKDIQDYKGVLKSEISEHINDTIDNLATGRGFNFSICAPPQYRFDLPCPLINGIIIPPQNLTTVE